MDANNLSVAEMFSNVGVAEPDKRRAPRKRKRRWSGPLVARCYFIVPLASGLRGEARRRVESLIDAMFEAMPHPALLVYLKACRLADRDGLFDMSAALARKARGSKKQGDGGDQYLALLVKAGLVVRVASGSSGVASEYILTGYSPQDEHDLVGWATKVFQEFKAARRRATATARQAEGREV
jgi:hypothetical protein